MEGSKAIFILLALGLHIAALYLGYRLHLWLLDKTASCSSWSSWWNKQQNAACDDGISTASFSHPQLALLQTSGLWIFVVGIIAGWRLEIILVTLAGLVLLLLKYPNDGKLPQNQIYVAALGYIAWVAILATTFALLMWQLTYRGGERGVDFFQKVAIGGAVLSMLVGALAFTAYRLRPPQALQDTGTCMDSALV